jgi:hypothetical protein
MVDWTQSVTVGLTSAGTIVVAAWLGGWKVRDWVSSKFDEIGDQFSETRKLFYDKIDAHESVDQQRHEENLERFADIRVEIARKLNGSGTHAAKD